MTLVLPFSDDDDGTVGNYDEASIRYRGDYIPSPSFRLLQNLARNDEMRNKSGSRKTLECLCTVCMLYV